MPGRIGFSIIAATLCLAPSGVLRAQVPRDVLMRRLQGLDSYVEGVRALWDVPGIGIGIVADGKLILARGYGYRDLGRKLPFTPHTLFPIGSNTKLFTAVAAGLLVQQGALTYDRPIRESVPSIRFSTDTLNDNVTLRDMLSHRTGITRYDSIWYDTGRTAQDLFDRIRYLEPSAPLRTKWIYNNLMYAAVGRIIEIKSGQAYSAFIRQRILQPLGMNATVFSLEEMRSHADYALPYNEAGESSRLAQMPWYAGFAGLESAGALISNVDDLSHWVTALMNEGRFEGRQAIPRAVIAQTAIPAVALAETDDSPWTHDALLGASYGLARFIAVYRGHLIVYHGGHIDGYRSQISIMPNDRLGVIVLMMGEHTGFLYDAVSFNIYERLLGLSPSSGVQDLYKEHSELRTADESARAGRLKGAATGTRPSHDLLDYVGDYSNSAYGTLEIRLQNGRLQLHLNRMRQPLQFVRYDRFDTAGDDLQDKLSVNFSTGFQGKIDRAILAIDDSDVRFDRLGPSPSSTFLDQAAGTYEAPGGTVVTILRHGETLTLSAFGDPDVDLIPYTRSEFRVSSPEDAMIEFKRDDSGDISGFYRRSPAGRYFYRRK